MNVLEEFHDSPAYYNIWVSIDDDTRKAWYWWQQGSQSCPHCCIAEVKPIEGSYCTNLKCRGKITGVERTVGRAHSRI